MKSFFTVCVQGTYIEKNWSLENLKACCKNRVGKLSPKTV